MAEASVARLLLDLERSELSSLIAKVLDWARAHQ
ncbi:MAG: hypothetical protein QG616_75 [Pseudomonadota bacterium]|nr:hypothetical protein [Pseudomonadota bacterium]